jgi:uncharacterized protein YpmS
MKNKWKIGFFVLVSLIALFLIILYLLISAPVDDSENKSVKTNPASNDVAFDVKTNKRDLNRVINHYLIEEGGNRQFAYEVLLTDEVELYGTFPLFSEELELKLTFEPEALDNGDLVLNQRSISVGRLRLPVSTVLKFVRNSYNLPRAVSIKPEEEQVYISMQNLKLKSNIKVRVNDFDLKKDSIKFTLLVPAE